ncbi:MAG: hypothetical protein R6U64_04000 [Bacteroidales bacterium]
MPIRSVSVNNSRLTEGLVYPFQVLKKVELDHLEHYWVMQDPMGYKILVPAAFYQRYGFKPGMVANCRVDKINCNGKMFLEPLHPYYKEGAYYPFRVVAAGQRRNILDEQEYHIEVKDVFEDSWLVVSHHQFHAEPGQQVSCLVERIKKGKLFLRLRQEQQPYSSLVTGQWYSFRILDVRRNPQDRQQYYILEGPDQKKHLLKKRYYLHYGLHKDQIIQCRVDKFSAEGYFLLEPQHPVYQAGQEYEFKAIRLEELVFSDGFRQKVLVLDDVFNEEVKVQVPESLVPLIEKMSHIRARVNRIRKSRPELELVLPDDKPIS